MATSIVPAAAPAASPIPNTTEPKIVPLPVELQSKLLRNSYPIGHCCRLPFVEEHVEKGKTRSFWKPGPAFQEGTDVNYTDAVHRGEEYAVAYLRWTAECPCDWNHLASIAMDVPQKNDGYSVGFFSFLGFQLGIRGMSPQDVERRGLANLAAARDRVAKLEAEAKAEMKAERAARRAAKRA